MVTEPAERDALLAVITVLLGTCVGLIAGILVSWAGATVLAALTTGGAAFIGTTTVTIALLTWIYKGRG